MIPRVFHFVFFTQSFAGIAAAPLPFMLHNYVAIASCRKHHPNARLILHTDGEITGEHWERTRPLLHAVVRRTFNSCVGTKNLRNFANVADLARAEILFERGGAYADLDTLFTGSIDHWFDRDTVTIGDENGIPMSNIICSPPRHTFIAAWLKQAELLVDDEWGAFHVKGLSNAAQISGCQFILEKVEHLPQPLYTAAAANQFYLHDLDIGATTVISLCQTATINFLQVLNDCSTVLEYNSTYTSIVREYIPVPDLSSVTVVLPVHVEHIDRLENVLAVVPYLHDNLYINNIIVIEINKTPSLFHLLPAYVRYIFVSAADDAVWNKSQVINTALPWLSTKITVIWDADCVVPLASVRIMAASFETETTAAVCCWSTFSHIRRHVLLPRVRAGRVLYTIILKDTDNITMQIKQPSGAGIFAVRTNIFKHLRGMSQLYWGWGFEDDDVLLRMMRMSGGKIVAVHAPLLHISHARTSRSYPDERFITASKVQRGRVAYWDVDKLYRAYGITPELGEFEGVEHPPAWTDEELALAEHLNDDAQPVVR